ncbi:class I SAM-dependent methyltransferase [Jannaschia aquimarina]|uniref:Tam_1 protein n=1 Tax=Jannaschia aquimarina TaxID=935700 RepID=A0A0D1EKZ4_9RHOB|nr:class I SAM-dependent methyltransferase [Jannaschia aquimarina]KIT16405.1 Trans-aconitate 2-methyltransferase [Jannaschia aquimarina]SNS91468.1 Methyltransferase domain-containing protein [Jannaschia aquimarina]
MSGDNYRKTGPLRARGAFHAAHGRNDWLRFVAGRLDLRAGMRVLDAGCGPGWLRQDVACRDLDLVLLDRSKAMVGEACAELAARRPRGIVGDLMTPPRGPFDRIVAGHVLYHVDDPGAALDVLGSRLAPDGLLIATAPDLGDLPEIGAMLRRLTGRDLSSGTVARFGGQTAERLMRDRFAGVAIHRWSDRYRITDTPALAAYLASYPGVSPDAPDAEAKASMTAAGGALVTERRQIVLVGRQFVPDSRTSSSG